MPFNFQCPNIFCSIGRFHSTCPLIYLLFLSNLESVFP
ncbi:unnamed protein product, partial [Arabidopsis halleri]